MSRSILDSSKIHDAISGRVANYHRSIVSEVEAATQENDLVVVGMKGNPHCKKARKILDERRAEYIYLEYGSYFGEWRRRSALKMWTGWPTFPMVFYKGTLIGGASELKGMLDANEIKV
jgi:glutaredoxin-related protein